MLFRSLMGSHRPLPEPEGYNDNRDRLDNGAYLLGSANRPASGDRDGRSRVRKEPSECCYGMVRRKSIASNHTSARSLIRLLHSYVTSPRSSGTD